MFAVKKRKWLQCLRKGDLKKEIIMEKGNRIEKKERKMKKRERDG